MERVIIRDQVLNWTMGEYAHINVRVPEGESVTVNWGDGQSTTHSGRLTDIEFHHKYYKSYKESESFVEISIEAEHILSVGDRSMDMERIMFDGSQAPSLENVEYPWAEQVNIDGCTHLQTLNIRGFRGRELKLPNLSAINSLLLFDANKLQLLDITQCPILKEVNIANTRALKRLNVSNDSRIQKLTVSKLSLENISPICLTVLKNIIQRNDGEIIDFYEFMKEIE